MMDAIREPAPARIFAFLLSALSCAADLAGASAMTAASDSEKVEIWSIRCLEEKQAQSSKMQL